MGLLAPGRVLELDIVQRRATVTQLLAALEIPPNPNVTSEDLTVATAARVSPQGTR